jgi:hypothetical protein
MSTCTAVATLPSTSTPILGAKGRTLGTRYFIGTESAKSLKETGKSLGLRGNALKDYVNKALSDESAARAATVAATVSALASKGFVADTVDVRKSSAQIKFVKPEAPKGPSDSMRTLAEKLVASGKFASVDEALAFLA